MGEFEDSALVHIESVACLALSLAHNEADATELVQETFLRAFRNWNTIGEGADRRQWLFTICRNAFSGSLDPRNEHSDEGDSDATPAAIAHMQAVKEGIANVHDRIDVRPVIEAAVRALPEPHHSILVLVDVEGLSYEQAAAVLDVPMETLRSRLYRARRHVQEALLAHVRDSGLEHHGRPVPHDLSAARRPSGPVQT